MPGRSQAVDRSLFEIDSDRLLDKFDQIHARVRGDRASISALVPLGADRGKVDAGELPTRGSERCGHQRGVEPARNLEKAVLTLRDRSRNAAQEFRSEAFGG